MTALLHISHRAHEEEQPQTPAFPLFEMMEAWGAFALATPEVRPNHHALYCTLLLQCKLRQGLQRFKLAYQDGMERSGIGSKATYLATLRDLETWKLITYQPGANAHKSPIVEVHFRESTGNLLVIYRSLYKESTDTPADDSDKLRSELKEAQAQIKQLKADLDKKHRPARRKKEVAPESDPTTGKGKLIETVYIEWYASIAGGVEPMMNFGGDGKAAKEIFAYLLSQSHDKTDEGVVAAFRYILNNWSKLDTHTQKLKSLMQIKSNLVNILPQLRNGHPTNPARAKQLGLIDNDKHLAALATLAANGLD